MSQIPPGGWQWYQPQTGWSAPTPIGSTHDQTVTLIIKHRLANPAIVAKHKLATDFDSVSKELIAYQQARGAIPPDVLPKMTPPISTPQLSAGVKEAVAAVKKMASGSALIFEWTEAGMPHVDRGIAECRAVVCVKCPKNEKGKRLTDIFTVPVAEQLKKKMEKLGEISLSTSVDSELAVCSACLCPLRTKVWVPGELILKRLKPDVRSELHESCWILKLDKERSA